MPQATAGLDISAVQAALAADGLDGWLLYDFHGLNPIACEIAGIGRGGGHLATRRWYYLIPASGEPRGLVHSIERNVLDHVPGLKSRYVGRDELEAGLRRLLEGVRRVAMEYSPLAAIPYIARVDAGTVELVRRMGVDVASSGDLVQRFATIWDEAALVTHRRASEALYRIKDLAFDAIARRLKSGTPTTEYDIQQLMMEWFRDEGLVTDSPPIVAAQEHAGNPHHMPTPGGNRAIRADEIVLLDLWGKLDRDQAVFADITWVGYTGHQVPDRYAQVFGTVAAARDAAVALVQQAPPMAASFAVGKWIARRHLSCAAPATAPTCCTARGTAWVNLCTGTASTWTITRPTTTVASSRARALQSNRASTSTISAFGRKSI